MRDLSFDVELVDRRFSQNVRDVGRPSVRKALSVPYLLARWANAMRVRPAVAVMFATNRPGSFLVDCLLLAVSLVRGVPVVHYLHARGYDQLATRGIVWRFLVGWFLRNAERVVCLGPSLTSDVALWVPEERISVIPNAVEVPADTELRPKSEQLTILFFSNLIPEKGALDFVRLAADLTTEREVDFRMAGAASGRAFQVSLDKGMGLAKHPIQYCGPLVGPQKWQELANADLLVFPSVYPLEAQPLSIIEALALGTPVVAYGTGGIPDLLGGGPGILVEPGNYELLLGAVEKVVEDDEFRSRMASSARRRYREAYSITAFSDRFNSLLLSVAR